MCNLKFKPGDRVRLIKNFGMNAALGSLATVVEPKEYQNASQYAYVKWDLPIKPKNPEGFGAQQDGGYEIGSFELVVPEEPDYKALAAEYNETLGRAHEISIIFKDAGFARINSKGATATVGTINAPYTFRKVVMPEPIVEQY